MKVILCLALVATAIPAGAQVAQSAGAATPPATTTVDVPGLPPGPDAVELRSRVQRLSEAAHAHARRLGLLTSRPGALPSASGVLTRHESRLRDVVGVLAASRELAQPVDERTLPARTARGGGAARAVHREYLRAARLAVKLGVRPPARPRTPSTRAARAREAARWHRVGDWLAARSEKLRAGERPLRDRVPLYEEFMCIASHESGARWDIATGNGYYGGLQMDRQFQQTYAPRLYRAKGTADRWNAAEQIRAAARAVESRGFTPWPNTARMCGLL